MEYVFKALSDLSRLRLLNIISREEMCVCELEVILEISQTNVSRHISKLKLNKIVESYKDAQWSHFRIHPEFRENHKLLLEYLEKEFSKHSVFIRDIERYDKYKKNNLNCSLIRKSKDKVLQMIS